MSIRLLIKFIISCLCICSIITLVSKPSAEDYKKNYGHKWEQYDSSYFLKFQCVNDIIAAADKHFDVSKLNTLDYYNYVAAIIRKRFYHGYSYYKIKDNPIAFLSGMLIWNNLSAIVLPDDILKHPMAACSQQSIVLMEVFKKKGINFRKVGFD